MKYRDPNTNTFKDLTVKVSDTLPIGTIVGYAGATAPDGWLICDGSTISRSLYSALFSAIGTSYGAGNGSTTFNIPDLRGRVGVGKSTDTEFNTLGKTGGEKTHTLTIEEIPSHTHMLDNTTTTGFAGGQSGAARDVGTPIKETSSTGGGQPHNILQPYIVENYIIKAYQPIAAPGKIVNSYSENPDNAYNTTYVNNNFEALFGASIGTILWTNPSPTEEMARNTTITLLNNNYDMYKIIYKSAVDGNEVFCSETIKGYGTSLIIKSGADYITDRVVYYVDDTHLRFDGAYENNVLVNSKLIPLYVIGYKTVLFD